jgi:hypothetical protein
VWVCGRCVAGVWQVCECARPGGEVGGRTEVSLLLKQVQPS